MKTRTKFAIVDTAFNYFLFTPLVLLFWYGTYSLIDVLIFSQIESRLIAAVLTLIVGLYIEFAITYWQVTTLSRARFLSADQQRAILLLHYRTFIRWSIVFFQSYVAP